MWDQRTSKKNVDSAEMSQYIYGFIEQDAPCGFAPVGIGNRKLTTICFKDIAAVVSDHPPIEFDRLDRVRLTELVGQHQRVIEQISLTHTIIPFQFGNIAESELAVRRILEQAYIQFKTLFGHIRGKVELVVQASANKQGWINQIAKTHPRIIDLFRNLSQLSETDKQLTQIEVGKIIFDSISQKEKRVIDDILHTLQNGGTNSVCGQLLNEEMLLNASFLIEKRSETEFDQKVNHLANKYADEVNFKYIGPMPPTSFVTLRLEMPDYDLINHARKLLGLPLAATLFEIKSAYRKLATTHHPDKNAEQELAGTNFQEIVAAYRILETYCQNYRYSFNKEAIENTVLIHAPEF
jgi:hypothetical protein